MGEGIPKGVVTVELGKPPQVVKDSAGFDEQKLPRRERELLSDGEGGVGDPQGMVDLKGSRLPDLFRREGKTLDIGEKRLPKFGCR